MIDLDAIAKRSGELRDFAKRGGILPDLRYFTETAEMLTELVAEVGTLRDRAEELEHQRCVDQNHHRRGSGCSVPDCCNYIPSDLGPTR